ncbi:Putative NADH-dependent dehydrogenase [hydrothermal vent metagenome]|uniref:NADH-dependent dehydrogenase n=1 Tax=hydrothermal vent metagenome TaxID=652676 RepID=A0A3B1D924_9ZZZZ
MNLTKEQIQIGKDNFNQSVVDAHAIDAKTFNRRDFMKGAAAASTGLGAYYFGYKAITGKQVKVGIIGTGDEGNILITQHPENYMDIVAVADIRPSNLKRAFNGDGNKHRVGLIKKLGKEKAAKVKKYKNHKELLADKSIEAVVIAVPLNMHAQIAMEALDAGKHVLSEKLMAHNITQCKEIIKKAKDKHLLYAVGHQRHYSVLYDNANYLVQQGLLGDIKYIRAQWHRNNSFPGRDSWIKKVPKLDQKDKELNKNIKEYGYESVDQLINWRLYNHTGGGLMAELGSHQLDAASIFLGKRHPLAVQGYGGKNFYGVAGVGAKAQQEDKREIDDHVYVTFEFPGPNYDAKENPNDICVVTYSSISTNRSEPYGEIVYGSRGTLFMKTEKDAILSKEKTAGSEGGPDQRLHVIKKAKGGAVVLDSYETTAPSAAASTVGEQKISRGYTEEMEHFCYCVREKIYKSPEEGGLRCNGEVAMADAIMALTANLAMKYKKRIVFKPEWFDWKNPLTPETDPDVVPQEKDV